MLLKAQGLKLVKNKLLIYYAAVIFCRSCNAQGCNHDFCLVEMNVL